MWSCRLEGLWWADDMSAFVKAIGPLEVDDDDYATRRGSCRDGHAAVAEVREKKQLPALDKLRFERFHEGRAAQIMHVGPFSEEGPTIERLHDFIRQRCELTGKHHEIYLSDVRRANPEKWKTILRQPMK